MSDRNGDLTDAGLAAVAGAGSFLVGYVVTYLWKASAVDRALDPLNVATELFGGDPIPVWKVVGWLFYGAHFVPTKIQVGPVGPQSVDVIAAGDGSLEILYLLPPVLLLASGFLIGWRTDRRLSIGDRALVGGAVALGYAPVAILTAIVVQIGDSGPDLLQAALVAGVLYPLVFGGVGALLAGQLRR